MSTHANETCVLVLVKEKYLDRLSELVGKLKKKGLHVTNVLEAAGGTVTGRIAPEKIDALRIMDEVEDVVPDEMRTLAPPDSPVQ